MSRFLIVPVLLTLVLGCSGTSDDSPADLNGGLDVADSTGADLAVDAAADNEQAGADDAPADVPRVDDTFRVGVAAGEAFAPLGIPTAGYGQGGGDGEIPHSPYTKAFAATQRQHTPILAKALYLQRGEAEFVLVRLDKIGTTPELLDEVTRALDEATGRSFEGRVVLASNHSHLGPGRLWENMVGEFANDLFWPQYYQRYVQSIVDVVLDAMDDAEPGRFGYARTQCPECHRDRRCENPELLDSTLWVARFDRADGTPKAVLLNFALHGTVFGWQDYVLSGDAPGMVEHKTEELFDTPVEVLLVQSWGGDVSPADPDVAMQEPANPTIPGKYDRLERIGHAAAQHVAQALAELDSQADVTFASTTVRPPIGYDLLNYGADEWTYPNGGMMCGTNSEAPCYGEPGDAPNMACIPMPPGMAPSQFVLSAFRIGELLFVTLPGEPHTDLSLEVVAAVQAATGSEDVVLVGYAQDHWGYLLKEYDWLAGGYEPTVSFWGPRQGQYIADQVPHVAQYLLDAGYALPFEPQPPLPPVDMTSGDQKKYTVQLSQASPGVVEAPAATVEATGAATVVFSGGDPWLGTPLVTLEREADGEFAPVLLANGKPLTNRAFLMETTVEWLPSWNEDKEAEAREFRWTVTLPARRNVPTAHALASGTYRFRLEGRSQQAGLLETYDLTSPAFALVLE